MDFEITEEQQMMIDTAKKVGDEFGIEYWRKIDEKHESPTELWKAVCKAGLAAVALPESVGGAGLGMIEMALIIETLAACGGGSTVGQLFMLNPIFGGISLAKYGSEKQKKEMLPGLCTGEMQFCMALTEPDAGTNSLEIKTFAEKTKEGFLLNGQKTWITAVPAAQKMLVIARTKKLEECKKRTEGITMFMIDTERDGLSHTLIDKVGTWTQPSSAVFFENVKVREDEVVGTLHGGWYELLDVLNTERIVTTSGLIGTTWLAERLAVDYANNRKIFGGRPISSYQGLQFPLAEGHAVAQCAKLMNLKAAWLCDHGKPYGTESNLAKVIAAQSAIHACDRAMQTMGGMGYSKEYHVERLWRDARLFKIAPVSEEMVFNFIATQCLGMPKGY
jgi:acyl-CoA dehydrogenase